MTSFLKFHALAASRGDGLLPELRALFESLEMAARPEAAAAESRTARQSDNEFMDRTIAGRDTKMKAAG